MTKKNKKKITRGLKKFWKFFWEEDSILSWTLNVIVAFLLIKFLIYPLIGFILGTSFPIVAVVSGSMEHKIAPICDTNSCKLEYCSNTFTQELYELEKKKETYGKFEYFWENCGSWYENIDIQRQDFESFPMKNGFNTGDIIMLKGTSIEDVNVGDIIVFSYNTKLSYPVIHRIVSKKYMDGEYFLQTKGDHNKASDPLNEFDIDESRIIGKAILKIPYVGWIKIWAFDALNVVLRIFGVQLS